MFHFVANLKPYTLQGPPRFDAFLLSVDYAGGLREEARACVQKRRMLVADNGNFDRIRVLAKQFQEQAEAAHRLRLATVRAGSYPRPGALSANVTAAYDKLAYDVEVAAVVPTDDAAAALAAQRALNPVYLIGPEVLAVSTLLAVGVQPEYLSDPYGLAKRGAVLATRGAKDAEIVPARSPAVFATLHAWDYDSAVAAGASAAKQGITGIATGLGGALQDRSFVDFRVEHGRVVELGSAVPRPYLRVIEIAAGLHAGFVQAAGTRPRFHALGAGSPIVLPLLALLGDFETYTATDSTSPIVDAWTAPTTSLYVDKPAPAKLKATQLAQRWLEDGVGLVCACASCRTFNRAHPARLEAAQDWWRGEGRPAIARTHLMGGPLAAFFPLLGDVQDPEKRRAAAMARVSHNHAVLRRIELRLRSAAKRGRLAAAVEGIVERYLAGPADPGWKAAVSAAYEVARRAAESMKTARPAPSLPLATQG